METVEQEIDQLKNIYNMITEFFVQYSFQLLGALLILIVGLLVANRVAKLVVGLCTRRNFDITLSRFLGSVTRIIILAGVAVICLNKIGINITPFIAAIGAVSLGAGLAVQGLLTNYSAGLNIIITRPFVVGDTISVQNVTGIVEEVHLAYTILKDEDEVTITIPNRHIIGEIIHNSRASKLVETTVGVAFNSNPEQVIKVISEALAPHPLSGDRPPQIGIDSFGDSSIDFGVRYWVPTERFHEIRFAANNSIYGALIEAGITIPLPQREIRLLNDSAQSS